MNMLPFSLPSRHPSSFVQTVNVTNIFGKALDTEFEQTEPLCWSTMIGQELYQLILINFLVTLLSTLAGDCGRALLWRYGSESLNELKLLVGHPEFQLSKSTLDLLCAATPAILPAPSPISAIK